MTITDMETITVLTTPERRVTARGTEGWYARIKTEAGHVADVSKLDGEARWVIDSLFSPKGVPVFVIGYGGRYCALTLLAEGPAAMLDAEVQS